MALRSSSSSMTTFPCPSIRVTGSITSVFAIPAIPRSVETVERLGQIHGTSVDQVLQDVEDCVRLRRDARDEVVHLHALGARGGGVWEDGDPMVVGPPRAGGGRRRRGVRVGLRQTILEPDQVTQRRDTTPDRTGADRDQNVAVVPEVPQRLDIPLVGDTALDESNRAP